MKKDHPLPPDAEIKMYDIENININHHSDWYQLGWAEGRLWCCNEIIKGVKERKLKIIETELRPIMEYLMQRKLINEKDTDTNRDS